MAASFPYLIELVEASTAGLKDISLRRLFGCDAFFVGEHIFVLLWKDGRIGVKLRDAGAHARLLALPGAEPWRMGPKVAAHWVLVPEEMHDDSEALTPWIREAYREVREGVGRAVGTATMVVKPAKVAAKPVKAAKPAAKRPTKVAARAETRRATKVSTKATKATAQPVARRTTRATKVAAKVAARVGVRRTGGR